MPKSLSLQEIFNALTNPAVPHSEDYFLFPLGTDTKFTRGPTVPQRDYERGETLSYAAQIVVAHSGEEPTYGEGDDAISFFSPSVAVLNGPATLGGGKEDRIARATLLALQAIVQGKKRIHFAAHSRGAVESILVMHELERIKTALQTHPEKTLFTILQETPCNETKAVLIQLLNTEAPQEFDTLEARQELNRRMNCLEMYPFLIDPVPGDTVAMLPFITWHDDRFYQQLPCSNYELLLCRDERSPCFYPINPPGMQATIIPGHHGSASGNAYAQDLRPLPDAFREHNTSCIQDLVLLKLIYFFSRHTSLFAEQGTQLVNLGHNALDALINEFITNDEDGRKKIILDKYLEVVKNDKAFKYFTGTTYKGFLWTSYASDGQRYIHYKKAACSSMGELISEENKEFVNSEHAQLSLEVQIPLFKKMQNATILQKLEIIKNTLSEMIGKARAITTEPVTGPHVLSALAAKEGQELFFSGLASVMHSISQTYLNETLAQEDRVLIVQKIQELFEVINNIEPQEALGNYYEVFKKCESLLKQGISTTVHTHFQYLVKQYESLCRQVDLFCVDSSDIRTVLTNYINKLDSLLSDDLLILKLIPGIKIRLTSLLETEISLDKIRAIIEDELKTVMDGDAQIHLAVIFANPEYELLKNYIEAQKTVEIYLKSIEQLQNTFSDFDKIYPTLKGLLDIPLSLSQFDVYKKALEHKAGVLFQKKACALETNIYGVADAFFECAKAQAIALGAPSPAIIHLQQEKNQLNKNVQELTSYVHKLQAIDEAKCIVLIEEQLLPRTKIYLRELLQTANISSEGFPEAVEAEDTKLKEKYAKVKALYDILTNTREHQMPKEKALAFFRKLETNNTELSLDRDPKWRVYFKYCVTALAIVITGLIPGLIGLATYAQKTGKSPLFFCHSRGQQYIEDVTNSYKKLNMIGVQHA